MAVTVFFLNKALVCSVFAMLAIFIALVALLTPMVSPWGGSDRSYASDNYQVDFGYQTNQGQAVVVCSIMFARFLQASHYKPYAPLSYCPD